MGATHCSLQVHVIFSTKDRLPMITDDLRDDLHRFIGGTLSGLGASPLRVGGVADHVHLLFGYRASANVSDLVREVKKAATKWMRETRGIARFAWQEGYAAIAVSPERVEAVRRYVANQAEHHAKHGFDEELAAILRQAGIPIAPRD